MVLNRIQLIKVFKAGIGYGWHRFIRIMKIFIPVSFFTALLALGSTAACVHSDRALAWSLAGYFTKKRNGKIAF